MEAIFTSPYFLAVIFFGVAFTYSAVGLGGGSAYTALMAIASFPINIIPMLSLSLNLLVTSLAAFNFIRNRHGKMRILLPFLLTSMPMAYLGGLLKLPRNGFYWVLLISLILVAARIYLWPKATTRLTLQPRTQMFIALGAGSFLGLIAGIAGIGGGIYLVPLIIFLGMGTEKEAAACGAVFIWFNSFSGLISRLQQNAIDLNNYLLLIVAVVTGGYLGSFLGSFKFTPRTMEKILGVLIIAAIISLTGKLLNP